MTFVTLSGVTYDVEGILSGLAWVRDETQRLHHQPLDQATALIRALVKERSANTSTPSQT
jgi:hypothetical protein